MAKNLDIHKLLSKGERVTLECKKATKSVPNSLWDTYSAFANTDGGIILLGVYEKMEEKDATKRFEIIGVEDADKIRKDLWNIIDKSNLIGDQRYSDRITYDGTWENNLFNFVRMVIPKLTSDLPHPFSMEGLIRKDDTLQAKAIREAVTNMIIHSDLMLNGILRVEKFDDRIVLTNPGLLKLSVEQIYHGGETKARNQRMQNMFRMIGYGENLGSGFPLILKAWNEKHWIKPELQEQPELMQVKLVLHIQNEPVNDPKVDPKVLTERQTEILKVISANNKVTREEIAKQLNLSDSTVKREIAQLKENGILLRKGSKYSGCWVVLK